LGERDRTGVYLEDLATPHPVGWLYGDATVESSRTQQRRVEDLGPVGRGENDHGLGGFETVKFGQDLIERLLTFIIGARQGDRSLSRAPDCIELVDEDDRRRGRLGLGEEVPNAGCSDADDRLDELRG